MDNINPVIKHDGLAFAKIKITCDICKKPVDKFSYKILEYGEVKIEVECHMGYEMWYVKQADLDGIILDARAFLK